jgi:hypothetical protein
MAGIIFVFFSCLFMQDVEIVSVNSTIADIQRTFVFIEYLKLMG